MSHAVLPCLQRPHTSEDMWLPSSVVSLHRAQQQSKYQYFLHRAEVRTQDRRVGCVGALQQIHIILTFLTIDGSPE